MADRRMNQEEIMQVIPHRPPFLLIDEVVAMEVGVSVQAKRTIRADDFWFQGHAPVTPGVLIVEMLAQAGAVCLLSQPELSGKLSLFGGIDKANFYRAVVPGDQLDLFVKVRLKKGTIGIAAAEAFVGKEHAVSCEICFVVVDPTES